MKTLVVLSIFGLLPGAGLFAAENSNATDLRLPSTSEITFEQDVRPILKAKCFLCHGEEKDVEGQLDVRLVRLLKKGGESGPAIVARSPDSSLLWHRIESDEMPEGPKKLSVLEKQTIRRWIEQGAATARPEPENADDARFTYEELSHWAYQPVKRPPIPQPVGYDLRTPVDNFVASRLAKQHLKFSTPADRRTLIRRVTFDLTGLPPTPAEVQSFLHDVSIDAYERLIDRLLASPQYGVRWGRHWLDVAGYAESDGGQNGDPKRPFAWHYRDYVVNSFNADKPIDQFLQEQLAGDEMVTGKLDPYNDRHYELLSATGFLRMAPDDTQNSNTLADRNMAVADALKVVSSAVLGVTVGCAQCHDHKYDPIGIDDYYRFRAIFDPAFPLDHWQQPNSRLVDLTKNEVVAQQAEIEVKAKSLEDDLNQRRDGVCQEILNEKLDVVPEEFRELARVAVETEAGQRTSEQSKILDQYPMVKPIGTIRGLLVEYDMPAYRKFEKEEEAIAAIRATKPASRKIMVATERADVIPESVIFFRGNPENRTESVEPAELTVLASTSGFHKLPINDPSLASTGRRLAYAKHLTNGDHPLIARVFVNRIWLHHLHRGLVATPSDFGISGDRPSHPNLLDWLADDFVRHGWNQKRLHRQIILSTTYQQSAERRPELEAIDPENRLFGRMNLQRLSSETLRDAIYAVGDTLDLSLGGASVPVTENLEGKVVIGEQKIRDGLVAGVKGENLGALRRSIFIEVRRSLPLNVLATFDQPTMTPNCELRLNSTVATQSLWFMNDALVIDLATKLAESIASKNRPMWQQIDVLFERLFSMSATNEEREVCLEFLKNQIDQYENDADENWQAKRKVDPRSDEVRAVAALCQTLLASNRFLYVD